MEFQSLNYTELASWVLVLGIVSLFTLCFQIFLIVSLRRLRKNLVESKQHLKDLRNQDVEQIILTQEDVKNLKNTIQHKAQICIELEHKFERLQKQLIKPKFKIGDKIETIGGIKGKIIYIKTSEKGFVYSIQERAYFGRQAKIHNILEFFILG